MLKLAQQQQQQDFKSWVIQVCRIDRQPRLQVQKQCRQRRTSTANGSSSSVRVLQQMAASHRPCSQRPQPGAPLCE